jgi:hypothetical protein
VGPLSGQQRLLGSNELFEDIVSPLLTSADVAGRQVADIGSGPGASWRCCSGLERRG